jgi:hypothetical protein
MAWTASVLDQEKRSGVVYVTVEYSDTKTVFQETYRTNTPSTSWIPDTVRDRIEQLNALNEYSIPIGSVNPSIKPPPLHPDIILFCHKVRVLDSVKTLIDMNVVSTSHAKVIELVTWLRDKIDYIDYL